MARSAKLAPHKDPAKGYWVVSVPRSLSPTGKRKREYFPTKAAAQTRSDQLQGLEKHCVEAARRAGPELIRTAVNFEELFRDVYGFPGGLAEACETFTRQLDQQRQASSFGQLVKAFETEHYSQWAPGTQSSWRAHRSHFKELENQPALTLTTEFWRDWLRRKTEELNWSNNTYNGLRGRLFAIYRHAVPDLVSSNPIEGVRTRKLPPKVVPVYSLQQIRALLDCAWEFDRELVPFFAIAIFAGLRPESELMRLRWEDVDFDNRRITVSFHNKTQTKRHVEMQANLFAWLQPWRSASGNVAGDITNFVKRRRWITRGKHLAKPGASESEWVEVAPYGPHVHDVCRHSFGSYMDAASGHDRNKLKEWMGHTNFNTYEQHYRNARTKEEGEAFLKIFPNSPSATV